MPRGDRTSPAGMGPMTGRRAGFCTGNSVPGYMNPMTGNGLGRRGRAGGGRGWRHWFYATGLTGWQRAAFGWPAYINPPASASNPDTFSNVRETREQELNALQGQAEYLEDALDGIKKRIEELEKQSVA